MPTSCYMSFSFLPSSLMMRTASPLVIIRTFYGSGILSYFLWCSFAFVPFLGSTALDTVSLPDNGTKALLNGLFETRKQPKLLAFPSHHLPKHRQSSLVPTGSVPAHCSLALLAAFTPSCLFLLHSAWSQKICDPQSVLCFIFGWIPHDV